MANVAPLEDIELHLKLPTELAEEARAQGLLSEDRISSLLVAELKKERGARFLAFADRLSTVSGPALTMEEVEAEIAAARASWRQQHADRR